jgi:serine/threonine-protein kinase
MEKDEGMYLGTPVYSSPEHALGKQVDGRSDIYALGVVAYEMLLGNPPFDSESSTALLMHHVRSPLPNPRSVDPEIPRDLEDFIVRACSKDPRDRYQTCHEIVDFFDSIERRQKVPSQVRVKNITFVYSPDLEGEVNRLAQTVQTMAESVDGLVTKIS